jgi:DNA-binding protein YbaB
MFDKLGQLKDLWKLKSQMDEIKKRLDNMVIKVESPNHWVEITISGSQEVKEVRVDPTAKTASESALAEDIKAVFNKAVRDSQMMAAQAMGNFGNMPQA